MRRRHRKISHWKVKSDPQLPWQLLMWEGLFRSSKTTPSRLPASSLHEPVTCKGRGWLSGGLQEGMMRGGQVSKETLEMTVSCQLPEYRVGLQVQLSVEGWGPWREVQLRFRPRGKGKDTVNRVWLVPGTECESPSLAERCSETWCTKRYHFTIPRPLVLIHCS